MPYFLKLTHFLLVVYESGGKLCQKFRTIITSYPLFCNLGKWWSYDAPWRSAGGIRFAQTPRLLSGDSFSVIDD